MPALRKTFVLADVSSKAALDLRRSLKETFGVTGHALW